MIRTTESTKSQRLLALADEKRTAQTVNLDQLRSALAPQPTETIFKEKDVDVKRASMVEPNQGPSLRDEIFRDLKTANETGNQEAATAAATAYLRMLSRKPTTFSEQDQVKFNMAKDAIIKHGGQEKWDKLRAELENEGQIAKGFFNEVENESEPETAQEPNLWEELGKAESENIVNESNINFLMSATPARRWLFAFAHNMDLDDLNKGMASYLKKVGRESEAETLQ